MKRLIASAIALSVIAAPAISATTTTSKTSKHVKKSGATQANAKQAAPKKK